MAKMMAEPASALGEKYEWSGEHESLDARPHGTSLLSMKSVCLSRDDLIWSERYHVGSRTSTSASVVYEVKYTPFLPSTSIDGDRYLGKMPDDSMVRSLIIDSSGV
jgi:hypothetical protein